MTKVILFGGGDAGGLIIGSNGVRPIPPFDPSIRLQLRGLSALINGIKCMPENPQTLREMGTLVNRVSNLVVEQVEAVVGKLGGDNAIVYLDAEDGFTCGSTGKMPIPIKWPPHHPPSIVDLITSGQIERELIDFVKEASDKGFSINEILENSAVISGKLGIKLSECTVHDLKQVAPSRSEGIADPEGREIVQFFNKVVDDGRYLSTWGSQPTKVAKELQVDLSDGAYNRIVAADAVEKVACGPVVAGVVVAIVIMLVDRNDIANMQVRDYSGIAKL